MKRLSANLAALLAAGALLGLNAAAHAQATTNFFTLAVDPSNTSNVNGLNAGDVLKLDVIFNSDNATGIRGYNTAIAFNSSIFSTATFTANASNTFAGAPVSTQNNNNANNGVLNRFIVGAQNTGTNAGTQNFPTTNTVLGTFNFTVASAPTAGPGSIIFTDQLPNPSTVNSRRNLLYTSDTATFTPSFGNQGVTFNVNSAAPVPEAGTIVSLAAMLIPASLFLRRKRAMSF